MNFDWVNIESVDDAVIKEFDSGNHAFNDFIHNKAKTWNDKGESVNSQDSRHKLHTFYSYMSNCEKLQTRIDTAKDGLYYFLNQCLIVKKRRPNMAIKKKDIEFMKRVAAYFRSTRSAADPDGSIRDTAIAFDLNRNKIRKILITMGELESPITDRALRLRKQGMTIREISIEMGLSAATISTYLPYEDKFDNSLDPSEHALDVRQYRSYEKEQSRRQAGKHSARENELTENSYVDKLTPGSPGVLRLHMELYTEDPSRKTVNTLKKYGGLFYGDNISRDILVPSDIPLYAIHYVIQRAFGWQNSHLRQFELPEEVAKGITDNNAEIWSLLVGILFRSPLMNEDDQFWADDYHGGSFKNWLRRKYTGPYMSRCHGEGIVSCMRNMSELDMDEQFYVLYQNSYDPVSEKYDGEPYVSDVVPLYDYNGKKLRAPKPWKAEIPSWLEISEFRNLPVEGLWRIFESNPLALLERLPVSSVLAAGKNSLPAGCSDRERQYIDRQICKSSKYIIEQAETIIDRVVESEVDNPILQPLPVPVTDMIIYNYDFGDNWKIKITASENCTDLVKSGRITQAELDRATTKCRELYRPVLLARDGEMLVDDVGGLHGFAEFLRIINPELDRMNPSEQESALQEKEEYMEWARSLGWHRENVSDFNLL